MPRSERRISADLFSLVRPWTPLCALALWGAILWGSAAARAEEPTPVGEVPDVTFGLAGKSITGTLIPPATDAGFVLRPEKSTSTMGVRWSSLEESDCRRVQKLLGVKVQDGRLVWGEPLKVTRFHLRTGRTVEGQELKERETARQRFLKNAQSIVQVAKEDIEEESTVEKLECDIYNPEEYYLQIRLRKPPDDASAADHLWYARECANMGLFQKALDHLDMAKTIDAKTEERTKDFRAELVQKYQEAQAQKLSAQIYQDRSREEWLLVLDEIERFVRNFPNSPLLSRIEALRPEIEEKAKGTLANQVILSYYRLYSDLIQERMAKGTKVDAAGKPVAAIPGKIITTKSNLLLKGTLDSESPDEIVLVRDELKIKIPKNEILMIQDADLSKGVKTENPTFNELKTYVTDQLEKDLSVRISQMLKIEPAKVLDIFQKRFEQVAEVKDGALIKTPVFYRPNRLDYAATTWLRGGGPGGTDPNDPNAKAKKKADAANANATGTGVKAINNPKGHWQTNASGSRTYWVPPTTNTTTGGTTGTTGTTGGTRGNVRPGAGGGTNPQDGLEEDPEKWLKGRGDEVLLLALKGLAAETIFKVIEATEYNCTGCGGRGTNGERPCDACHATGKMTAIIFE